MNKIIVLFIAFYSILFPIESRSNELIKGTNKRIISLNSLGADIVAKLDIDSLVGIPGSSLLKKQSKL